MLSYQQALDCLFHTPMRTLSERVPITQAGGRTVASDLVAPYPMPPFDQSLMDGYAVRSAATRLAATARPRRFTLELTLTAGEVATEPVPPGQAVRIMTGAPMPPGTDAVIKVEDGELEAGALVVRQPVSRGQFVQRRGAEVRQQTVIVRIGERLTPQRIGMALALGLDHVEVRRRPRLAFVAPGDELLAPGAPLQPGKKWCSNLYALEARARELDCETLNLGIVPDTLDGLMTALRQGLAADTDILMILGASGQGDHDFAGRAMTEIGAEVLFRGVAMVPGRGTVVARRDQTLIFGLPGSPWATFVTFETLVQPLLQTRLGQRAEPLVTARLEAEVRLRPGLTHIIPVRLQASGASWLATPLRALLPVAQAESDGLGWIAVPPHRRQLTRGAQVRVHRCYP